ncbi:N-(5'-phosphoribosyl)anthranilate isomerase [Thalassorhabdomicrobium marinisediminis]|uniref:N-(5'-phosphoribosyl)anthranilate isomerase n=1 Tax=Thalassorhabdomicrobium marinisediminis TaxID=2170577 RepID=UPI0024914CCE|nr:N-(5'-phosphoribosyl)anthranilate isomerase [Thalassorhabdomicrobium marinisediminis]
MEHAILPENPELWFRHFFAAQAALDGGVVRRKVRDMERTVGRALFEREIRRRGFTAVENAGQVVIFCNAEPVRTLVGGRKSS